MASVTGHTKTGVGSLLVSFGILLGFYGAGEGIVRLLGLAYPGSIIGMALLAVCLVTGLLDVDRVAPAADLLLSHLGLFFVPPAAGIMLYFDVIAADFLALTVATVVSLIAVLWATALTARALKQEGERHD